MQTEISHTIQTLILHKFQSLFLIIFGLIHQQTVVVSWISLRKPWHYTIS